VRADVPALTTYAVTVAATITATAATVTAGYARSIHQRVGDNEDRSMTNREMLVGEPEILDEPVVDRVRRIEGVVDVDTDS
jgi:hypothetical protein